MHIQLSSHARELHVSLPGQLPEMNAWANFTDMVLDMHQCK